ncbi:DUF4178 domain-containing protein [Marinobacter lacisalsi]|uniref:DUF4178 domain-containing protein n=1 Tax=Marinobacter lacisalsi TaxID=475979 RepID=A0ABV8QB68_9GAMM
MVMDLLLLALLVVAGVIGYRLWSRQSSSSADHSGDSDPQAGGIESVRSGGVIQLPPHGPDMAEADVQITARHVYQQDGYRWFELEGESGSGTVWLDVERDDELETSVTLKRLRIDELGLDEAGVEQLKRGATVSFDGAVFRMTEQGTARFLPDGDESRAETLEYWDLEGDDDRHDLTIERWGQDHRAYLSQRIPPSRIKVYRTTDQG